MVQRRAHRGIPMGVFIGTIMPNTQSVTLQELVSLALPSGTRVVAGRGGLNRAVTWVVITPAMAPSPRFASSDLVILLPPYTADLEPQLAALVQISVAGVALIGEPARTLMDWAEQAGLPLIALPTATDLRLVERAAMALLLDRSGNIERRTAQLYQQLTMLSAEEAGLEAMAALIGQTTGKSVLIQDKRLKTLAAWFTPELSPLRPSIESWVGLVNNLPESLRDRRFAAQAQASVQQLIDIDSLSRLVAPIVSKGMARGFLSLVAATESWSMFERRAAEQSASACALEMAKAKAVSEAEKRVRGSFVDAMLSGSLVPLEAERWARRNKYDPAGPHAAIVVDWANKQHPSYRRLETLVHGCVGGTRSGVLTQARENEIVLFCRLESKPGIETARRIAESIRHQAAKEFPNDPLAIGVGRAVEGLSGLRDSYREARQALMMARRLAEPNPLYFGELKVYRLLFQLEHSPELEAFCHEMIGTLIAYDRAQGTDLVETLSAYFAHKGNLSQTAEALFVHRNTLLYRMERIREISGLDLDNPETRLSIQLALRAWRLLTAREE